ncbi:hypothetical protein C1645_802100 [Glomus cerebriforme]|uniref:HMG box domain-containing protein n=1 Tax=Glomus cerebriforme TaxID=658196 RepID=A0A397TF32_9GLOM|nr:hypothetical protein C1645_802100 [Glomus cerebriforme]
MSNKKVYFYVFNIENSNNHDSNNNNATLVPPPDPNKAICLDTNAKTDDEIIYNSKYKFNLDIDILTNNSDSTRFARRNRRRGTKKIPRRQNAWILYRRDKSMSPEFFGLKTAFISKEISKMWNNETKETRVLFETLARKATEIHMKKYGEDYKYEPKVLKKSSKIKESVQSKKIKIKKVKNLNRKEEKRVNQNQKFLSELMNTEQQLPPTPATSSPASPSSLEFEQLLLELTMDAEQYPPTPAASVPATPLEFEQLLLEFTTMDAEQTDDRCRTVSFNPFNITCNSFIFGI